MLRTLRKKENNKSDKLYTQTRGIHLQWLPLLLALQMNPLFSVMFKFFFKESTYYQKESTY